MPDLLTKLHIGVLNLTDTRNGRKSTSADGYFRGAGSALRKVLLFNFKFERIDFLHQASLLLLFLS